MIHEQVAIIGPVLSQKIETIFPQVAVDGGILFATHPILWVGDGDSGQVKTSLPLKMKPTQDETDLRFCLNEIQGWKWKQLHLYGFLGKRKDHEWANLGEVCQELKKRALPSSAIFYDEALNPKIYLYQAGSHSFKVNGVFSILSFESTMITISGECDFKMKDQMLLPFSGRGVSNVGHGPIQIQCGAPVMVILVDGE